MKRPNVEIIAFTFIRTILNSLHRMVYPFISTLARGVGVDLTSMSYVLTIRNVVGTLGPLAASTADRHSRKAGMLLGAVFFTLGAGVVVFWPTFPGLAIAITISTLGKCIFDPSLQAYLGDRIPYERRGRLLAITEFSWSFAFILGVPLLGFLISKKGWLAPFPLMVCLGLGIITTILLILPSENGQGSRSHRHGNFKVILTCLPALSGLLLSLCMSAANEVVNLIFGVWLEHSFQLQIAALGAASAVVGFSELAGEGLVAGFVDRIGKHRSVALGLAANSIAAILLPIVGRTETGALLGLFFFYISFEFTVVSMIPLMTEIVPSARATLMAFNIGAFSLGRAMGDLIGPRLYELGFWYVVVGAVLLNIAGLLILRNARISRSPEDTFTAMG